MISPRRRAYWLCAFAAIAALSLAQPPREPAELTALVSRTRASLDTFWRGQLLNYKSPTNVRAYKPDDEDEPCGPNPDDNAYYCIADGGIYYDVGYLERWRTTIGEYAAITTLAHEWGHRIQHLLGLYDAGAGLFTLQKEMMADCLSGAYIKSVNDRTPLSEEAKRHITLKLAAVGDRETPWYHPSAHGRPGQRLDAFNEGFDGRACTSEDFFRALGIDRDAVQLAPPGRGSLRTRIPPRVARFELGDVRWTPTLLGRGAIETLEASYRSSAKVQLKLLFSAFPSPDRSNAHLEFTLSALAQRGFKEARRSRVAPADRGPDQGVLVVLEGAGEIIVWTHGAVFGAVEGPRDYVWEFVSAFL